MQQEARHLKCLTFAQLRPSPRHSFANSPFHSEQTILREHSITRQLEIAAANTYERVGPQEPSKVSVRKRGDSHSDTCVPAVRQG